MPTAEQMALVVFRGRQLLSALGFGARHLRSSSHATAAEAASSTVLYVNRSAVRNTVFVECMLGSSACINFGSLPRGQSHSEVHW